jgi:hypothetical protein
MCSRFKLCQINFIPRKCIVYFRLVLRRVSRGSVFVGKIYEVFEFPPNLSKWAARKNTLERSDNHIKQSFRNTIEKVFYYAKFMRTCWKINFLVHCVNILLFFGNTNIWLIKLIHLFLVRLAPCYNINHSWYIYVCGRKIIC